ncbi:MAG: hypothetical protein H8E64_08320 [Candidatus Marinimicrobia bacterium]|nr:hypothetical protein [Candidatus Neomarinimicrobiota bacterium]
MKHTHFINHFLWLATLSIFIGCTREPEPSPDDSIVGTIMSFRLDPDSTSYFRSYRSSPEMGGVSELFYGSQEGYSDIYSLVEITPVEADFFLDTLYSADSLIMSVFSINAVYFTLNLVTSEDTITPPELFYFSSDGDTNLFSQEESSFFTFNIDGNLQTTSSGAVTIVTDTLDNSSFQFDVTDIFQEFILDTNRLNSFTYKIIGGERMDSLVAFNAPKMDVHYFRISENTDSTWTDTLTTTFSTIEKLTIVNPGDWVENEGRFSIGRAKGLKSILKFNLDTLNTFSDSIVFKDADLYLQRDGDEFENAGYKVLSYPLRDSVDMNLFSVEVMDTTSLEFIGASSAFTDTTDNYVILNLRNFIAYLHLGQLSRYELQLSSSAENNPFITQTFINDDTFHPYIKVRYVVTK